MITAEETLRDSILIHDILLSMLAYELYLMIKWDKADGIIEVYEMLVRAGSPALHMGR